MKVLVVSSRFPWPPTSGDRLRASIWLEALAGMAEVTLVAPPGIVAPGYESVRHVPLRRSIGSLLVGAGRTVSRGFPYHAIVASGFDWEGAIELAREPVGQFDSAVVMLSRCELWITRRLPAKRVVLDAIDALSVSAEQRALAGSFPGRWFWAMERKRMERLESAMAERNDAVLVVNDDERRYFGDRAFAVSNAVEIEPEGAAERPYDFGFWGNLRYFANRDAIAALLGEVWPRIRRREPGATLLIAGADAPRSMRAMSGRNGVTVVSPMDDRVALLRQVKIALLPLRFGSGVSNKVLEAAEASCAIAGTSVAFRGLDDLSWKQIVDDDLDRIAERSASLLRNGAMWREMGRIARARVVSAHDRAETRRRLVDVVKGIGY